MNIDNICVLHYVVQEIHRKSKNMEFELIMFYEI